MLTRNLIPDASNAFLAIACAEQKMSHAQAWQIELMRRSYLTLGLTPPKTGEIAEELVILLHADVEWILNRQVEFRGDNKTVSDPLTRPSRTSQPPVHRVRIRGASAAVVLILLAITWFASHGDFAKVAITGEIATALWLIIENIWPTGFNSHVSWYRGFNAIPAVLVPLSVAYGTYVGLQMRQLVQGGTSDPTAFEHLWYRLVTTGILLTGITVAFLVVGRWRHREIWFLGGRIDLMRSLVAQAFTAVVAIRSASRTAESKASAVQGLLQGAARVLSLNPWAHLLERIAPVLGQSPGGTVLWYLEPEGTGFVVRAHVAPGAPAEVAILLQEIANNHKPVALDLERYRKAKEFCTRADGSFNRDAFLAIPDRSEYVSLVGYVFARRQAVGNGDTSQCLVFDRSYLRKIDIGRLPAKAKRWLDFASAAAYPVFSPGHGPDQPVGVLLAFKCVKNGITAEDKSVLVMLSKLIGIVVAESRNREEFSRRN
jgi:hypothetical protein